MTKTPRPGIEDLNWQVNCSLLAHEALEMEDVQACLERHLFRVDRTLRTRRNPMHRFARTISYDRHGREFWILSVYKARSTMIALPAEVREEFADA